MEYSILIKILEVYSTNLRRQRELYVLHCLRIASKIEYYGFNPRLQLLGALHDAVEVPGYQVHVLADMFKLDASEVQILNILTVLSDENSQQHFDRVLASKNIGALIIKYFDCLDNSEFLEEDFKFTQEVLNLNPIQEQKKYQDRMKLIVSLLKDLGIDLFDY